MSTELASAFIRLKIDDSELKPGFARIRSYVTTQGASLGRDFARSFNTAVSNARVGGAISQAVAAAAPNVTKEGAAAGMKYGNAFGTTAATSAKAAMSTLGHLAPGKPTPKDTGHLGLGSYAPFNPAIQSSLDKARPIVEEGARSLGNRFDAMLRQTLQGLGLFATGIAVSNAIKGLIRFDDKMTEVRINARLLGSEGAAAFGKLQDKAKELAATTMFNPAQTAAAINLMVKAGLSVSEVLKTSTPAVQLAAASNQELGAAVEQVTRQLKIWNIEASKASQVTDVLLSASTRYQVTVSELAQGLAEVGKIAQLGNLDMVETTAILGGMREVSHSASKAFIGMSSMIFRANLETNRMSESLDKMGLNLKQFVKNGSVDIKAFFKALQEGVNEGKYGTQDLLNLFMHRGREAAKLFAPGADGKGSIFEEALKAADEIKKMDRGFAAKAAEERMNNLRGKLLQLRSAVEDFSLVALAPMVKMFTVVAQAVTAVFRAFNKLNNIFLGLPGLALGATTAFVAFRVSATYLAKAYGFLAKNISAATKSLLTFNAASGASKIDVGTGAAIGGMQKGGMQAAKAALGKAWSAVLLALANPMQTMRKSLVLARRSLFRIVGLFKTLALTNPWATALVGLTAFMAAMKKFGSVSEEMKNEISDLKKEMEFFDEQAKELRRGRAKEESTDEVMTSQERAKRDLKAKPDVMSWEFWNPFKPMQGAWAKTKKDMLWLMNRWKRMQMQDLRKSKGLKPLTEEEIQEKMRIENLGKMPAGYDEEGNPLHLGLGRIGFEQLGNTLQDKALQSESDPLIETIMKLNRLQEEANAIAREQLLEAQKTKGPLK